MTGVSGFIGSHLAPKLIAEGHEVWGIERYVTGRYGKLNRDVNTYFVDLTDFSGVGQALRNIKPDVIIHLASVSPVVYSYDHPLEVTETNFLATVNLAESCRKLLPEFSHMISAQTTEEYGMTTDRPATEETQCIPNSPYSVSKYATTRYLQYMVIAYGFPVTMVRPTNSYGRAKDTNFFIERAITQMLAGKEVRLGDPTPIRDWLYVDDHVNAYLTVLHNREKSLGELFNISTNTSYTVKETAEKIAQLTGYKGDILWNAIPRRPLDIIDHRLDSSKMRQTLGWKSEYSLEDGLKKTIDIIKGGLENG